MRTLLAALTSALLLGVTSAHAATIPLYSTGVDNNGALLPANSADPHWTVNGLTAFTLSVTTSSLGWAPNLPNGQWISGDDDGTPGTGSFTYATTFDLTDYLLSSVSISATISADDGALVFLNGTQVFDGTGGSPWASYQAFTISSGFSQGINTLSASISNSDGPGGALFQIVGAAGDPAVPEPGTLSMLVAGGVVGMVGLIRRRRRQSKA